jgi:hypothetical protein
MANNHDLPVGALRSLRYQVELFQEHPCSDELRAKLRNALGTAKARLSLPLQPGPEVDQWRIILQRYVRRAKLAMDSQDERLNLAVIQDTLGLFLRLIKSTPHVPRGAVSCAPEPAI